MAAETPGTEGGSETRRPRQVATDQVSDIGALFKKGQTELTSRTRETKEERLSRLKREEETKTHDLRQEAAEKELRRRMEVVVFWLFVAMVAAAFSVSLLLFALPGGPDETKKQSYSLITSILVAGLGYLVGKSVKLG